MQFNLFSVDTPQPVDLRSTKLPDLAEAAAQVGTVTSWQMLTLSQVLELWNQLYADFVASLGPPIEHARSFCQEHGEHYGEGGPGARKFYQREVERLMQGQRQLHATVENLWLLQKSPARSANASSWYSNISKVALSPVRVLDLHTDVIAQNLRRPFATATSVL